MQAMYERDRLGGGGAGPGGEGRFRLPTSRHSCIVAIVFVRIVEQ